MTCLNTFVNREKTALTPPFEKLLNEKYEVRQTHTHTPPPMGKIQFDPGKVYTMKQLLYFENDYSD